MPLNRFTVLPRQEIFNTHVAQDLSLTDKVLAAKQGAYDQGETFDLQNEGTFGKFAVRNVDIARRDALHDAYVQQAKAIVDDKYQGDYGQALPELRKLATATAGNEFFTRATSALQRQKDMYETEKTIQKKGGSAIGFNRDAYGKAVYNEDGTYNDIDYDVQERLDYAKPKIDLMKDIAKDTRLSGLTQAQISGVLQHGSMKGVDGDKVLAVAKNMLRPYLDTPEGQQEMRYLTQVRGMSGEQALAGMVKSLAGIGSKQVGQDADMDYMPEPGYVYRLKKADKAAEEAKGMLEGPEGLTGMTTNPMAPAKLQLDGKGRPFIPGPEDPETSVNMGQAVKGTPAGGLGAALFDPTRDARIKAQKEARSAAGYEAGNKALQELRRNYDKVHRGERDYKGVPSDKQLIRLHNEAAENAGLVAIKEVKLLPKAAEGASSMILGPNWKKGDVSGLQGRMIMPVSPTGKGGKLVTLPEAMEEFGLGKDTKIVSAQVTGRTPYNPLIPGGYRVTLTVAGKKGENPQPKEIIVAGSQQEEQHNAIFQPLIAAAYAGKNGRADSPNGKLHYKSITATGPDGKFHTQVRTYEITEDGHYVAHRERDKGGKLKKDSKGHYIFSKPESLDEFTKSTHNLFLQGNPGFYNAAGYQTADEKAQVELSDTEDDE